MIYKIESIVFHIKAKMYVQKNDKITFQTCFHFFQISDLRFEISDFRFQVTDFRFQVSDFRLLLGWGNRWTEAGGTRPGHRQHQALSHCIRTL